MPADRLARGAVLPPDRGRGASTNGRTRCSRGSGMSAATLPPRAHRRRPGVGTVYRGSCASCARRSAPTSASAWRRSCRSSSSPRCCSRAARRRHASAVRALRARDRPRDPARRPDLRLDLAVPADHRARRGRHRRHRGQPRHAEDDPHPLGRPLAGVRRQGARGAHLRVRGARAVRARGAGRRRADLGLRPAHLAVGDADPDRPRAAPARPRRSSPTSSR